jgi:hypothetical protein
MDSPSDVIPAKAGPSTAKLVIHFALDDASNEIKMDPRFRGDDDFLGSP